jgi:hypothetical protein
MEQVLNKMNPAIDARCFNGVKREDRITFSFVSLKNFLNYTVQSSSLTNSWIVYY